MEVKVEEAVSEAEEDEDSDDDIDPNWSNPYAYGEPIPWPMPFTNALEMPAALEAASDNLFETLNRALAILKFALVSRIAVEPVLEGEPVSMACIALRGYQLAVLFSFFHPGRKDIVVRLPTGTGKTIIIVVLLRMLLLLNSHNKIWLLAPTTDLLIQLDWTRQDPPGTDLVLS